MSNRERIIDKIKKCLALGASSNEHEAAAALRQAKKLMDEYGISDLDMHAAGASENRTRAGAIKAPSNWETCLAAKVADAFTCRIIFSRSLRNGGEWVFIGTAPAPELATYAFTVLHRQAKRARAEHIAKALKRCKTATKTRRADLFSEGWVCAATALINAFAGTEEQVASIDAYMEKHYPTLHDMKARDRNGDRNLSSREFSDYAAGNLSGRGAQLNHGVGGASGPLALE